MIFLILHWTITFAHQLHGKRVVYMVPFSVTLEPTSNMALSSACRQRQLMSSWPEDMLELHLVHPPSKQFFTLIGVPLYPIEITLYFLVMTQPTALFMQLDHKRARKAMLMKYSSMEGLNWWEIIRLRKMSSFIELLMVSALLQLIRCLVNF